MSRLSFTGESGTAVKVVTLSVLLFLCNSKSSFYLSSKMSSKQASMSNCSKLSQLGSLSDSSAFYCFLLYFLSGFSNSWTSDIISFIEKNSSKHLGISSFKSKFGREVFSILKVLYFGAAGFFFDLTGYKYSAFKSIYDRLILNETCAEDWPPLLLRKPTLAIFFCASFSKRVEILEILWYSFCFSSSFSSSILCRAVFPVRLSSIFFLNHPLVC